jgi:hypothetical protein
MAHLLRQTIIISALTVVLAAIDPCSEVYPGLNVDFTTTQSKVKMPALSSCAGGSTLRKPVAMCLQRPSCMVDLTSQCLSPEAVWLDMLHDACTGP